MNDLSSIKDTGAAAALRRRTDQDPSVFVLSRELSEVHLLLDNISANPTTTVTELATIERPRNLGEDWIERVCEINWPPDVDDDKAADASLLISAKDYLNRLSHPASGSTIAFTLLVTQENERARRRGAGEADPEPTPPPGGGPSRASLAEQAYPDLMDKALRFRAAMRWMCIGLVVALLITCMLSWYVAYGNAALSEYETASMALTEAQTRVNEAEAAEDQAGVNAAAAEPAGEGGETGAAAGGAGTVAATPAGTAAATGAAQPYSRYCRRTISSATQAQACTAQDLAQQAVDRAQQRLASWVCITCIGDGSTGKIIPEAPSLAAARANIMGSAMLPFLYGLLGAGAAIIRSLSRKIRASLLSPRDLHLSLQQLALGAVIGAVIGMFVAAPDGEGLLGPVTLSASAISFIAGFGVEAVFQAIESLITRIFNLTTTPNTNRGDGVTHP